MAIDRNQGITGILNPELENVRKAVQETPELGDMYSQFFGGSYQPDIEGGTGTAQYYDFSGKLDPYWAQKTIPVGQEPEPVVQDPTTMIPQTGGGEEITGASVVQPAGGEQINVDTPLTQMITTPTGDSMTVKEAFTQPEAYSLPGESDPFLASGAAGGARLPATQATTTLPSGDVFATDDPMLQEKMDYTEKTPAWWESARDKFVQTGQDVGGFFGDLKDKGINVGQIAIGSLMNMVQPGLGLLSRAIPEETSEDVWNKQFAFGGENFQDIVTSDPDLGKRLEGYSKDLIAGTGGNKDPFGRNTVSAFGDYEARLAEDLQYTGDSQFSLDKKAYAQAYFDKKGIGLNPNEAKAFEEKYGISPTGAPVTRDRLIDEGIAAADQEDDMFEPTITPLAKPTGIVRPGTVLGKPGIEKFDDAEADMLNTATAIDAFNAANRQKHFDNTQKLKDAVAEGKITPETYNKLSAFDATKTMGLDPITGTLSSIGYQGVQTLAGDQGIGDFLGDTARNIQGVSGNLTPEEQVQYQEIISGEDIYRDSILGMVEEPDVGTLAGDYGDAFEDYDINISQDAPTVVDDSVTTAKGPPSELVSDFGEDIDIDQGFLDTTPEPTPTFESRGGGADRDPAPPSAPSAPSGPPPGGPHGGGGADRDPAPSAPVSTAGQAGPPSQRGGGGNGGGGCFLKGTQVTMADGTTKPVEQVDLGNNVAKGGKVFATGKFLVDNLHDYKGIKVSGSHMVNEDGNWIRVEDSKHGKPLGDDEHTVYVFGAENRRILINDILFTDYFEVNEQEKLSDGDKFFDNWKLHAKVDSDNNVNVLNAS